MAGDVRAVINVPGGRVYTIETKQPPGGNRAFRALNLGAFNYDANIRYNRRGVNITTFAVSWVDEATFSGDDTLTFGIKLIRPDGGGEEYLTADELAHEQGEINIIGNNALRIVDDGGAAPGPEQITVTLSVDPAAVVEGMTGQQVEVTATLEEVRDEATVLTLILFPGTADEFDFMSVADFDLTIPMNAASAMRSFTFMPVDDGFVEGDEFLFVTATISVQDTSTNLDLTLRSARLTITDNDFFSTEVGLSPGSSVFGEDGASGSRDEDTDIITYSTNLRIMLNGAAFTRERLLLLFVADDDSSATVGEGEDFVATVIVGEGDEARRHELQAEREGEGTALRIDSGLTAVDATLELMILDDRTDEGLSETIVIVGYLAESGGALIEGVSVQPITLFITDDDEPSTEITLALTASNGRYDEPGNARGIGHYYVHYSGVPFTIELNNGAFSEDKRLVLFIDTAASSALLGFAEDYTATIAISRGDSTDSSIFCPKSSCQLETEILAGETRIEGEIGVSVLGDRVDEEDETIFLTARVEDEEQLVVTSITLTIIDNDESGFSVLSPPVVDEMVLPVALQVMEESSFSYFIALTSQPLGPVSLAILITGEEPMVSFARGAVLTERVFIFTVAGWNTYQEVVIYALADQDGEDEMGVTIVHSVASAVDDESYRTARLPADRTLTVIDDDRAGIIISSLQLSITEGERVQYHVNLNTVPSADVLLRPVLEVSDDFSVTVAVSGGEGNLLFTSRDWNTPQSVDILVNRDFVDAAVDTQELQISHMVVMTEDANYRALTDLPTVTVTISDVDTRGTHNTGPMSATVTEGGRFVYDLSLLSSPTDNVVVIVEPQSPPGFTIVVTPSPATRMFTPADWNDPQSLFIHVVDDNVDADAIGEQRIGHELRISHSLKGGDYTGVSVSDTVVSIIDNDKRRIDISKTGLTLDEDGSPQQYTLALHTVPAADEDGVLIDIAVPEGSPFTVAPARDPVLLTPATPSVVVTITPIDDLFAESHVEVVINHSVVSKRDHRFTDANFVSSQEVSVRIDDDDETSTMVDLGLEPDNVGEGRSSPEVLILTASLNEAPFRNDVTVRVTVGAAGSTAELDDDYSFDVIDVEETGSRNDMFDLVIPAGERGARAVIEVTVTDDEIAEGPEIIRLNYSSVSGLTVAPLGSEVTIIDNETATVSVTPETRILCEGAAGGDTTCPRSGIFVVSLSAQFPADERVTVTITPAGEDTGQYLEWGADEGSLQSDDDLELEFSGSSPLTMNFVVAALDNDIANVKRSYRFEVRVSSSDTGSGYGTLETQTIEVTVEDRLDEVDLTGPEQITVTLSVDPAAVVEGMTGQVKVTATLEEVRDEATVLTLLLFPGTADASDFMSVADFDLTIPMNAASAMRSFTFMPVDDGFVEGDEFLFVTATISVQDTSTNLDLTLRSARLTITDDDDPSTEITLALTASNGRYDEPDNDRGIGHYVRYSGVPFTIELNNGAFSENKRLFLSIDTAASSALLGFAEDYTVSITISRGDSIDTFTFCSVSSCQLETVILAGETRIEGEIGVSVRGDRVDEEDETIFLTARVEDEEQLVVTSITLMITDNDESGFSVLSPSVEDGMVLPGALQVIEGSSFSYFIALTSQPLGPVNLAILIRGGGSVVSFGTEDVITERQLTFTAADWNTYQEVVIYALADQDGEDETGVTIVHSVASAVDDETYRTAPLPADRTLTVIDDDMAGIIISFLQLSIMEGERARYNVNLNTAPSADVLLRPVLEVSDDFSVTVAVSGGEGNLLFTSENWNTPQSVDILVDNDFVDAAVDTQALQISHVVMTEDANYGALTDLPIVTVTISDVDTRGTSNTGPVSATVTEGERFFYDLSLLSRPTDDVVVVVIVEPQLPPGFTIMVTQSPATRIFTPADWRDPQRLTIEVVDDNVDADAIGVQEIGHELRIRHSLKGGDYTGVSVSDTVVSIIDNDKRRIDISPTGLTLDEDGSPQQYELALHTVPAADEEGVLIDIAVPEGSPFTVAPARDPVLLTPATPSVVVTITPTNDLFDEAHAEAVINHSVASGRTHRFTDVDFAPSREVIVRIDDDDETSTIVDMGLEHRDRNFLAVSPDPDNVGEGRSSPEVLILTASLNEAPFRNDVTVRVTVGAAGSTAELDDDYRFDVIDVGETGSRNNMFDLVIPGGRTKAQVEIGVSVVDDGVYEGNELILLQFAPDNGLSASAASSRTIVVFDNNRAPTRIDLQLDYHSALVDNSLSETFPIVGGQTQQAQTLTLTARLGLPSATSGEDVVVQVTVGAEGSTAMLGDDYRFDVMDVTESGADDNMFDLVIPAGEREARAVIEVTVTDDGIAEGPEIIRLNYSSVSRLAVAPGSSKVTIIDNETATVSVTPETRILCEGAAGGDTTCPRSGIFVVSLSAQFPADERVTVTITPAGEDTGQYLEWGADEGSLQSDDDLELEFSGSSPLTMNFVVAALDNDIANVIKRSYQFEVSVSSSDTGSGYGTLETQTIEVTVEDRLDEVGLNFVAENEDGEFLDIIEGDTASVSEFRTGGEYRYGVVPTSQPPAGQAVEIAVSILIDEGDAAGDLNQQLMFTSSNWRTTQTVRVTLNHNRAVTGARIVSINHTAMGGGVADVSQSYDGVLRTLQLTVTDNESPPDSVALTTSRSIFPEGDEDADTEWVVNLTAMLTGGGVAFDEAKTLTLFFEENGSSAILDDDFTASIEVNGQEEFLSQGDSVVLPMQIPSDMLQGEIIILHLTVLGNDVDEDNKTIVIGARVEGLSDDNADLLEGMVQLTIRDDDTSGVVFTGAAGGALPRPLIVRERGEVTYRVALTSEPTAEVQVIPASRSDIAFEPAELVFTPENWRQAQPIILRGVDDPAEAEIREIGIGHSLSSVDSHYAAVPSPSFPLELIDPSIVLESAGGLVLSLADSEVQGVYQAEVVEGASVSYNLRLTSMPTLTVERVETGVLSGAGAIENVPVETLQFSGSSGEFYWNDAVPVNFDAEGNDYYSGDRVVVVEHESSDDRTQKATLTLTVTDDESPPANITLSLSRTEVAEAAGTVELVVMATLDVAYFKETLLDILINDDIDFDVDTTFVVQARRAAIEALGLSLAELADEGTDFEFDVPKGMRTLTISTGETEGELTFMLTVEPDDYDEGAAETVVISAGVRSPDEIQQALILGGPATLTIDDDDDRGVRIVDAGVNGQPLTELTVVEEADHVSYYIVLTSAPLGNDGGDDAVVMVTIDIDYGPDSENNVGDMIFLNGAAGNASVSLTFGDVGSNAPRWDVPQQVTVSLGVNLGASGGREATLTHTVTSADSDYDAVVSVASVELTLTDAGVTIDPTALSLTEDGSGASYTVSLVSQPTGEVRVTVTAPEGVTVNSGQEIILTFTPGEDSTVDNHWSSPQQVNVDVMDDGLSNGMRVLRIEHSVSSDDPNYDSLSVDDVVLTITDDEMLPDIRLTLDQIAAVEGSAASGATGEAELLRTIQVTATAELVGDALRSQPTTVILSFGGPDDTAAALADYRIAGSMEIEIPAGQRSAAASFELTLVQDRIDEGDAETFAVTVTHMETEALRVLDSEIVFTINDDDTADVGHTLQPRNVRQGDEIPYTVVLTSQPEADVVVEAAVSAVTDSAASDHVTPTDVSLTFTPDDWHVPQTVMFSVADPVPDDGFGEFAIEHSVTSGDSNYDGFIVGSVRLELTDVDLSLQTLELRLDSAGADALALMPVFNANMLKYSADIPFGTDRAFIRAVATVTEDIRVGGELVQNAAEVRILFGGADLSSDDAAELPATESDFEFLIVVSALPVEQGDETALQTYTLTLRRALPPAAALLVFPASDEERQRPLMMGTPLNFGPDVNEMDLIFVVRDEDGNRYSISELEAAGTGLGARVFVDTGSQTEPEEGAFETPVTLRRDQALMPGTFTFNLTFTATPQRPLAVGAEQLTADIAGTLYDNSDTATGIRATYRGHAQEEALPVTSADLITVSSNGTLTIALRVERLSGGLRDFEQASFTLSVTPADLDRVNLTDDRLEIQSGDEDIVVMVNATGGATLGDRINNPAVLRFSVSFVRPTAEIRPAASADALFDFDSNLFFAFVDEDNGEDNDNRLPLEVVLTGDSTPLADSGRILGGIRLTSTAVGQGASNAIRIGGAPGRDLLFEVMAPRANVRVTVERAADASAELTALVDVASLEFAAHLLSFTYDDDIEIDSDEEQPVVISRVMLRGAGSAESWTLSVGNPLELAAGGYEVEEVVVVERATRVSRIFVREVMPIEEGSTTLITTYSSRTVTVRLLDGDGPDTTVATAFEDVVEVDVPVDALAMFAADDSLRTATVVTEIPATYRPATEAERQAATVTRTLRITSTSDDPRNSRILLGVDYRPGVVAEGAAGSFSRIIALLTGREAELNAEVRGDDGEAAETIVLPRGGSTELTLVISNLSDTDDPNARGAITYRFDQTDLRVAPLEAAEIDRNNRRSEQRLTVEVSESADRAGYEVFIDVRLGGRIDTAKFSIDINDAPEYVGETLLTVRESGDAAAGGVQIHVLTVRDPDGGLMELRPSDLTLEAVLGDAVSGPFAFGTEAGEQNLSLPYFSLASGSVEQRDLAGGANELFVTLTLTGRLATPFGSVVELRLSGATDGYDVLNQRLLVQVEDVAPTFSLAKTTVTLFADQREVVLELDEFSDGRRGATPGDQLPVVVVQHAPDDLVVRFDREQRQVTLIRLNDSQDGEDEQITLVVVDSQGGRTEVTLDIARPPLLPQIVAPSPLLEVADDGQEQVRIVSFAEPTDLEVSWTASVPEGLVGLEVGDVETLDDGSGRVAVSASLAVAGRAFMLELTATSDDGMQQRTVELPVVVVAPAPRPRLQLSLKAADPADPTTAGSTVSNFLLTDTLFVQATLAGQVPQQLVEAGRATTFTLSIARLGPDGEPIATATVEWELTTTVEVNADLSVELALTTTVSVDMLQLDAGDVVEISIRHVFGLDLIEGDRLRLPVVDLRTAGDLADSIDVDNDGLVDAAAAGEVDPTILGPIEAAVAAVTDQGAEVQDDELSLSLGNLARSLNLGQCGGVTLALTVAMDGTVAGLSGCGGDLDLTNDFNSLAVARSVTEALTAGEFDSGEYQLIDLSVRFDSSETEADEPVLINLPPHPEEHLSYEVYRLVEATWVPVIDAGLPGGAGGAGALESVADCDTCFYGVDDDRDGSVELLLLLQSVEEPLNLEVGEEFRDRRLELDAGGDGTVIPLSGLRPGLTPVVTGSDNVEGEFSNTVATGGRPGLILTGVKRTLGGPEEVLVELFDDGGGAAVASFTLQVGVGNRPPVISFELENGEEITTTVGLNPNTETVVIVVINDPDGDDSFRLELAEPGDREIADLVSRAMPSADSSAVFVVEHRLVLTSGAARSPFRLRVRATDLTDPDDDGGTLSERLTVCVLNEDGKCPAASRPSSGGGGGGGGGSGLLWLFLAAPATLVRLRRRQRPAATARFWG